MPYHILPCFSKCSFLLLYAPSCVFFCFPLLLFPPLPLHLLKTEPEFTRTEFFNRIFRFFLTAFIYLQRREERRERIYPNTEIFFIVNKYPINSFLIFQKWSVVCGGVFVVGLVFSLSWGKRNVSSLIPIRNILVLVLARGGEKETHFKTLYVASIIFRNLLSV